MAQLEIPESYVSGLPCSVGTFERGVSDCVSLHKKTVSVLTLDGLAEGVLVGAAAESCSSLSIERMRILFYIIGKGRSVLYI